MEFLFLNEAAAEVAGRDELKEFVESTYNVEFSDMSGKSFGEIQLECEEAFHEAEVTAMKEEFALYQESLALNEEDEEGKKNIFAKAWDKIKEWWRQLCAFITKLWLGLLKLIDQAVAWVRKAVLSVVSYFKGTSSCTVPKSMWEEVSSIVKMGGATKAEAARLNSLFSDPSKFESVEKAKAEFDKVWENAKKASEEYREKLVRLAGEKSEGNNDGRGTTSVTVNDVKSKLNDLVNLAGWLRKQADVTKKAITATIKKTESDMKSVNADKAEIKKVGTILRLGSSISGKYYSLGVSDCKWLASKIFSMCKIGKKSGSVKNGLEGESRRDARMNNQEHRTSDKGSAFTRKGALKV